MLFAVMGEFYDAAEYRGQVDVGIAAVGIEGGVSGTLSAGGHVVGGYAAPTYTRTQRVSAGELREPDTVAARMLGTLFDATNGGRFDPWTGSVVSSP